MGSAPRVLRMSVVQVCSVPSLAGLTFRPIVRIPFPMAAASPADEARLGVEEAARNTSLFLRGGSMRFSSTVIECPRRKGVCGIP